MAAENGPLINEGVWVAISFVAFCRSCVEKGRLCIELYAR